MHIREHPPTRSVPQKYHDKLMAEITADNGNILNIPLVDMQLNQTHHCKSR